MGCRRHRLPVRLDAASFSSLGRRFTISVALAVRQEVVDETMAVDSESGNQVLKIYSGKAAQIGEVLKSIARERHA